MARELRQTGGYNDPGLVVNVRDEARPLVLNTVSARPRLRLDSGYGRLGWRAKIRGALARAVPATLRS